MLRRIFRPFLLWLALWAPLHAAVDLVTLPTREGTQLTIYNSEDITMVREHRLLTVKEGINRIQFSWANTLIDPTSIEFRILDKQDKVDLADTTFPAGRSDALQWNIKSQIAGKIPVEIRYFTSGITWAADYVGIANEDERKADRVAEKEWLEFRCWRRILPLKYRVEGDTLLVRSMDGDAKKRAIESGKIKGTSDKPRFDPEKVEFTDKNENVARFVAGADDSFFSKEVIRLKRVK
jgi:hypothetical protein